MLTLSDESLTDAADAYRKLLTANRLQIVSDQAQGTSTTLKFADGANELSGSITIDAFSQDDAFTETTIQLQSAPGFSGTPTPATPTPVATAPAATTPAGTAPAGAASPTATATKTP